MKTGWGGVQFPDDDDVILENCDVIVIFLIYRQFGAIQVPDSGCM